MSIDASPPPNPPMLSPDGKWFWDGTQWQPIATETDAGHIGVFPEWNTVHVDAATAAPQAAQPVHQIPMPMPGIQYAPVVSSPLDYSAGGAAPLWRRQRASKLTLPMYVAGGAIGLVVVVALLGFLAQRVPWPWSSSDQPGTSATGPILPALTTRSDYARADRFVTGELTPAVVNMGKTLTVLNVSCSSALTNTCQTAIDTTDAQVKIVLSIVDKGVFPPCIGVPIGRVKVDLTGVHGGLTVAAKAFADNSRAELANGIHGYQVFVRTLEADLVAVGSARNAQCDTRLVGP